MFVLVSRMNVLVNKIATSSNQQAITKIKLQLRQV